MIKIVQVMQISVVSENVDVINMDILKTTLIIKEYTLK